MSSFNCKFWYWNSGYSSTPVHKNPLNGRDWEKICIADVLILFLSAKCTLVQLLLFVIIKIEAGRKPELQNAFLQGPRLNCMGITHPIEGKAKVRNTEQTTWDSIPEEENIYVPFERHPIFPYISWTIHPHGSAVTCPDCWETGNTMLQEINQIVWKAKNPTMSFYDTRFWTDLNVTCDIVDAYCLSVRL